MVDELSREFRGYYRGRHRPEDALWWLSHPGSPGPSSAPPPQDVMLMAADELDAAGAHAAAMALLEATAELLAVDRRATLDALQAVWQRRAVTSGVIDDVPGRGPTR